MSTSYFAGKTNSQIFTACQAYDPQFKAFTAGKTLEKLEAGWEAQNQIDYNLINSWFDVTMRIILNKIDVPSVKNPLEDYGVAEAYDTPYGVGIQRISMEDPGPVNPAFLNIQDGGSVDPQKIRIPKDLKERVWTHNWHYQSWITLREAEIKTILASEYGMDIISSGYLAGLERGLKKQRYLNELEALNALINSQIHPLQDTQKIEIDVESADSYSANELTDIIRAVRGVYKQMELAPSTKAYNALKWDSAINTGELVLLARPDLVTEIALLNKLNAPGVGLPVQPKELLDFGGLKPYTMSGSTKVPLYPVYDDNGTPIGWATSSGQTTATVDLGDELYEDSNADVICILIQKGSIFTTMQNGVEFGPQEYNRRGRYRNYVISLENGGVHVDSLYNVVVFKRKVTGESTAKPQEVKVVNGEETPIYTVEVTPTPTPTPTA